MNREEIQVLAANGSWNGEPVNGVVIETHISWVILTASLAFKIKRPVQFSFLDFSTLERRQYYCHREVELNRRFSDIYLDVVPIYRRHGVFVLGGEDTSPIDYAVRMEKMDSALEMDRLLAEDRVSYAQIDELAGIIAAFHTKAEVIRRFFDRDEMKHVVDDLRSVSGKIVQRLGTGYAEICEDAIEYGGQFLNECRPLLEERVRRGFRRDVHGDLHTGNVFLSRPPTLFDCIEFDDALRQIDILDEVAFLCMDLEARGHRDLSKKFQEVYCARMNLSLSDEERALFVYFKIYRASVRAKVMALKDGSRQDWQSVTRYLEYIQRELSTRRVCPAIHERAH